MIKSLCNGASIALTVASFVPYILAIHRGKIRPHVFSWVIWALTTIIVFFAQLSDGAGIGAWPTGMSGLITLYVAFLCYRIRTDDTITRSDWIFFGMALASLPLWYLTHDPLWAVSVLTLVDGLGFGPTVRHAYHHPHDEQLQMYVVLIARNLLSIAALENYSWTTVLFPAVVALFCAIFVPIVFLRRIKEARGMNSIVNR